MNQCVYFFGLNDFRVLQKPRRKCFAVVSVYLVQTSRLQKFIETDQVKIVTCNSKNKKNVACGNYNNYNIYHMNKKNKKKVVRNKLSSPKASLQCFIKMYLSQKSKQMVFSDFYTKQMQMIQVIRNRN